MSSLFPLYSTDLSTLPVIPWCLHFWCARFLTSLYLPEADTEPLLVLYSQHPAQRTVHSRSSWWICWLTTLPDHWAAPPVQLFRGMVVLHLCFVSFCIYWFGWLLACLVGFKNSSKRPRVPQWVSISRISRGIYLKGPLAITWDVFNII